MKEKYHLWKEGLKTFCGQGGGRYRNNFEIGDLDIRASRQEICRKCLKITKKLREKL